MATKRFQPWIFALFFCGMAGLFMAIGGGLALSNGAALRRLVQGEAVVVRQQPVVTGPETAPAEVEQAEVMLRFRAGGQEHLVPAPVDVDEVRWDRQGVDTHPALRDGATVIIWYDPDEPEAVRLDRTVDPFPYVFILFPMIHFTVGLAVGLFAGGGLTPVARARRMALLPLVWNGVGGACLWHFLSLGGSVDVAIGAVIAGYGAVGLILLSVWRLMVRKAAEAPVSINGETAGPLPDR